MRGLAPCVHSQCGSGGPKPPRGRKEAKEDCDEATCIAGSNLLFSADRGLGWYGFPPVGASESHAVGTFWNDQNVALGTFNTFCLEAGEDFSSNQKYQYTIDTVVIQATGSTLVPQGKLTQGAVDLYVGYFAGSFPGRTAQNYQDSIWNVQGYGGAPYNKPFDPTFVNLFNQNAYAGNAFHVLNLFDYTDAGAIRYRQSFLLPVPDGGATLMLLGGALMGLGALRRKFRG